MMQTELIRPIELSSLPEAPLVSILVPNYNYAKFVGETLESVLRQTYSHFEAIVCDDGSKDSSCEIIETYVQLDSRIKLIRKPNGGVASALNTAYREAKGEIICLLDADDIWLDQKLERIVVLFKSNTTCGFAIHNVIQIDGQGDLIKATPMYGNLPSGWLAQSALENGGFVDNIPPASALSIRRQVAELIFPLNEEFVRNADSLIFRFAPLITGIASTTEVLSQFRIHGANTTSAATVTVEFMERELVTIARVHAEQKQFLLRVYDASIAERLTDVSSSLIVCQARYLISRLRLHEKSERQQAHQKLITHPKFKVEFSKVLPQKFLLKWGEYLPNTIFKVLFNQVYGLSLLKLFVRRLISKKLVLQSR